MKDNEFIDFPNSLFEKKEEKTLKLVHQKERFPLEITEKLEKKIRVLCNKFPSNEWSGILFYSCTGSFKGGDIAFKAEDLFIMDVGVVGTTEFYTDEANIASYICDHDLFGCYCGLVH